MASHSFFPIRISTRCQFIDIIYFVVVGVVLLYLSFDSGFMQVRVPGLLGEGVPMGEVLLILLLPTLRYFKMISKLSTVVSLMPFIAWWGFGFIKVIMGYVEHGTWALRDATSMIESLYIIPGFMLALYPRILFSFLKLLPKFLIAISFYALGYPFQTALLPFSPLIKAASGYNIPFLFVYTSKYMILLFTACYLLFFQSEKPIRKNLEYAAIVFLFLFSVVCFQARTLYFQLIALTLYLQFNEKAKVKKVYVILLVSMAFLILASLMGVEVKGRLGETTSVSFILDHFMSSFGVTHKGLEGSATGVYQRMDWWSMCIAKWSASIWTMLFGVGYGIPLTNFTTIVVVREPHNSFLSLLTRLGITGIVSYIWMSFYLISSWKKALYQATVMKWVFSRKYLLWMMSFPVLVLVLSLGEDGLEKPFISIPYYFLWGIMLGLFYYINKCFKTPEGRSSEDPLRPS